MSNAPHPCVVSKKQAVLHFHYLQSYNITLTSIYTPQRSLLANLTGISEDGLRSKVLDVAGGDAEILKTLEE